MNMSSTSPTLTQPQLWNELWTSFASLLRSYCAAHGLSSEHQAIVEVGANTIMIRVNSKTLTLTQKDGKGSIAFGSETKMPLTLLEDGRVTIGPTTEEMDIAAERLAREILQ